jgi:hypothetical protein
MALIEDFDKNPAVLPNSRYCKDNKVQMVC